LSNFVEEKVLNQYDLGLTGSFFVSNKSLIGCLLKTLMMSKTWDTLPRKLGVIVDRVRELYLEEFDSVSENFYLKSFDNYTELYSWLEKNLLDIPEIEELNLSDRELKGGVNVSDENRPKYVFSDAYSAPCDISDDFIDLTALIRNLTNELIREQVVINFSSFK